MYGLLYHISRDFPGIRGGFVHVPFIPAQVVDRSAPSPSLALADIVRGLEAAIQSIGESDGDLAVNEGKEF
jgi:pyroglutamyl-peptidase